MFRKKVYGESRLASCPFCGRNGVARNSQGVPVCEAHRSHNIDNLRCACGSALDLRIGKWGPYGFCDSCGNISWSKVCELNSMTKEAKPASNRAISMTSDDVGAERFEQRSKPEKPKEITIRSDDPDFF